jgi:hypothetical protein
MKNAASYSIKITGCIFFAFFFLSSSAIAQKRGRVEVIKDPLIDTLIARRPGINNNTPANRVSSSNWGQTMYGYRVQIYSGSNRQEAYSTQARFNAEFPEYRTYITYLEPNFKVHAGDFRTRLEAEKLKQELVQAFSSLFIIPTKINPPKPESSND